MIGNQSNTENANNETNQTQHANENPMNESPPSPGNPFNPGPAGPSGIKISNSNEVKTISTLVYLIIVQDVITVQDGQFPKLNKRAGCNKAMQVEIFQISIVKKSSLLENFQKIINVQDVIRSCRLEIFKNQ